jgi:xanthine/uracil permease
MNPIPVFAILYDFFRRNRLLVTSILIGVVLGALFATLLSLGADSVIEYKKRSMSKTADGGPTTNQLHWETGP